MAVTTVSDLNGLFNTIYERALFVARERTLMASLVDVRGATGWMDRNWQSRRWTCHGPRSRRSRSVPILKPLRAGTRS